MHIHKSQRQMEYNFSFWEIYKKNTLNKEHILRMYSHGVIITSIMEWNEEKKVFFSFHAYIQYYTVFQAPSLEIELTALNKRTSARFTINLTQIRIYVVLYVCIYLQSVQLLSLWLVSIYTFIATLAMRNKSTRKIKSAEWSSSIRKTGRIDEETYWAVCCTEKWRS